MHAFEVHSNESACRKEVRLWLEQLYRDKRRCVLSMKHNENVMGSSAGAEFGAPFHNCHEAEPICTTLPKMGHIQPATPIQTDNSTTNGIVNNTVRQKQSKPMDMRFYWVRDIIKQDHFHVFWKQGTANLGDGFNKHCPSYHHIEMRPIYLFT